MYEAYLAQEWDKTIFTAVAPNRGESWRAAATMLMSLTLGTLTGLAFVRWRPDCLIVLEISIDGDHLCHVSFLLAILSQSMSRPCLAWHVFNALGVVLCAMSLCINISIYVLWISIWWSIILLVFFMLSEADILQVASVQREAEQLARYSSITGADSSNEEDKRAILSDVGDKVDAVDKSIGVLLDASMSTTHLRFAAERGVDVTGAAEQRLALGWVGLSLWCKWAVECKGLPEFYVCAACIIFYIIKGACAEADERAFLLSALFKLFLLMLALPVPVLREVLSCAPGCGLFSAAITLCSIVAVLCAAAGLSGLARIPCIGRCLVGTLAPSCRSWKCCSQRKAKRFRGSSKSPAGVATITALQRKVRVTITESTASWAESSSDDLTESLEESSSDDLTASLEESSDSLRRD